MQNLHDFDRNGSAVSIAFLVRWSMPRYLSFPFNGKVVINNGVLFTELVMSGSFSMSIVNEDGTTSHPSAIVGFDPATNTFTTSFKGGLFAINDVHMEHLHLQSTPL